MSAPAFPKAPQPTSAEINRANVSGTLAAACFGSYIGVSKYAAQAMFRRIRGAQCHFRPSILLTAGRWSFGVTAVAVVFGSLVSAAGLPLVTYPLIDENLTIVDLQRSEDQRGGAKWEAGGVLGGALVSWRRAMAKDVGFGSRLLRMYGGMGIGVALAAHGFMAWRLAMHGENFWSGSKEITLRDLGRS